MAIMVKMLKWISPFFDPLLAVFYHSLMLTYINQTSHIGKEFHHSLYYSHILFFKKKQKWEDVGQGEGRCSQISNRETSNVKLEGISSQKKRFMPVFSSRPLGVNRPGFPRQLQNSKHCYSVITNHSYKRGHRYFAKYFTIRPIKNSSSLGLYPDHCFSINRTHSYGKCHGYFAKCMYFAKEF